MQLFWRFLKFFKPYRWRVAQGLGLVFLAQGLALVSPRLFGWFIDSLKVFADLGPRERSLGQEDALRVLLIVCACIAALRAGNMIVSYTRDLTLTLIAQRLLFDLRQRLFRHLQSLSLRFYETQHTGRIMSRVLYDVDVVQSILGGSLLNVVVSTVTLVAVLGIVMATNWRLGVVALVVMPLYAVNFMVFRKRLRAASADAQERYSDIYGTLSERISGVKIVKSFVRERSESRRFVSEVREQFALNVRTRRISILMDIGSQLITGSATLAILYFGGREVIIHGRMSPGELVAFNMYMGMVYRPITTLVKSSGIVQRVLNAIERIFETLDMAPEVREKKDALVLPDDIEGRVEFRKVDFSYEPGQPVLQDINFTAEPGKMIALVGPSGGGKSTLVNLIPRFYDPDDGAILVDGYDLRDVKLSSLRKHIGMVLQETFLFSGTIRANIRYGKTDATDAEIVAAAQAANAHDFIMEFPEGYETEIGERGVRLSGGQRQRIAIARAILRNPKLLILDEATSSLDSEAEALIQEALDKLMQDRTTFVIAHRLSTVMNADEILVIDEGRIVERGTHLELAEAGGVYQRLCRVQFRQSEEMLAGRPAQQRGKRAGRVVS
ncbi:MAG: ABC transporter ATP-binding protein [Armatimonadota bacterium]